MVTGGCRSSRSRVTLGSPTGPRPFRRPPWPARPLPSTAWCSRSTSLSPDGLLLGALPRTVRQRMAGSATRCVSEGDEAADGWLAARRVTMVRERNALLARRSTSGLRRWRARRRRSGPTLPPPGGRHRPPLPAAARPGLRRGRTGARRLRVATASSRVHRRLDCSRCRPRAARRGAGVADRTALNGRWQRCQPRVRSRPLCRPPDRPARVTPRGCAAAPRTPSASPWPWHASAGPAGRRTWPAAGRGRASRS